MHCHKCRVDRDNIGISIPIEMLNEDLFVDLYIRGLTESDPDMAVKIVFGEAPAELVERVNLVLGRASDARDYACRKS